MIKGLIIDKEYGKAENMKILLENTDVSLDIKTDILQESDDNFCLMDLKEYDFLMTHIKNVNETDLRKRIMPYLKKVMDRRTDHMTLSMSRRILFIDRNNIIGLEVMGKTCYVHTRKSSYLVGRISLGHLMELLEDPNLVRCHKSYAINIKYIRGFEKETRTRWKPIFLFETEFDCRITDIFLDDVVRKFEEVNGIVLSKKIEL